MDRVLWSPHHANELLTVGDGLRLLRLEGSSTARGRFYASPGSEGMTGHSFATAAHRRDEDLRQATVVDWSPRDSEGRTVAVGLKNGTVEIVDLVVHDPADGAPTKFKPGTPSTCTCLSWNPQLQNFIAVGHNERSQAQESSLAIWDITSCRAISESQPKTRPANLLYGASGSVRAVPRQLSAGSGGSGSLQPTMGSTSGPLHASTHDVVRALAWLPDNPHLLLFGTGNNLLRMYDVRMRKVAPEDTKAIAARHISVDPLQPRVAAINTSTEICLFDLRAVSTPFRRLSHRNTYTTFKWCPTRAGLLGAMETNGQEVHLYDISVYEKGKELNSHELHKTAQPLLSEAQLSFDWSVHQRNSMVLLSSTGFLQDIVVAETLPLSISARGDVAVGALQSTLIAPVEANKPKEQLEAIKAVRETPAELLGSDISTRMYKRAADGYGLTVSRNAEIAADDPDLAGLWTWLSVEEAEGAHSLHLKGIKGVLGTDSDRLQQYGMPSSGRRAYRREQSIIFPVNDKTPQRAHVVRMCGWHPLNDESALDETLAALEENGDFERASALALFHHDLRRAVQSLSTGASKSEGAQRSMLLTAAMSLAGYTADAQEDSLWQDTCAHLRTELSSPYLRAAFAFLTSTSLVGNDFEDVLKEKELILTDRVAFACRYLTDESLPRYLEDLIQESVATGSLDGLKLTGVTTEGLAVLQAYVDRTSDVQTAAVLLSVATADTSLQNSAVWGDVRTQNWIGLYRDLLDSWRLWIQRAKFDVDRLASTTGKAPPLPKQVYVRCNYCQHAVTGSKTSRGVGASRLKPTTCPRCKKPLPRCPLCLLHLGTAMGSVQSRNAKNVQDAAPSPQRQFGTWFTWCQSCRHGGHADHYAEWFSTHSECPVAGCECRCDVIDAAGTQSAAAAASTTPARTSARQTSR